MEDEPTTKRNSEVDRRASNCSTGVGVVVAILSYKDDVKLRYSISLFLM